MSTIYILSNGSYSDAIIIGAFSSEDKAKEAEKQCKLSEGYIEAHTLDPILPEGTRTQYCVSIRIDSGNIERCYQTNNINLNNRATQCFQFQYHDGEVMVVICWADDEDHAKKIATEKRQEHIAKKVLEGNIIRKSV